MSAGFGRRSCRNCRCFELRGDLKKLTPVTFPLGRLRLATSPRSTGSIPPTNTIGIVEVAAIATESDTPLKRSPPHRGGPDLQLGRLSDHAAHWRNGIRLRDCGLPRNPHRSAPGEMLKCDNLG